MITQKVGGEFLDNFWKERPWDK